MTALPQPLASDNRVLQPEVRVEYITPQIAEAYLERNMNNRALSSRQVSKYAFAMTAGDWQLSDPIKFDTYGRLIDGQHRLAAIVQSGVTVAMFVARGLDSSAQDVIDTGRARTAADALRMHGYRHYSIMAAGARLTIAYDHGWIKKVGETYYPRIVTTPEVLRFAENNPQFVELAGEADTLRHHINAQPSVILMTRFVLGRIDEDQARAFFADLAEMKTSGVGDPRSALLKRLNVRDATDNVHNVVYMFFRAWNATRLGEPMRLIKVHSKDATIPTPI